MPITIFSPTFQTPTVMTPSTPFIQSRVKRTNFEPPFASPLPTPTIEENSPAHRQSIRNKSKLALLEKYDDPTELPILNTTPNLIRQDPKFKNSSFKVPFMKRLENS